jgi:nucleoid-associated protein YgaU
LANVAGGAAPGRIEVVVLPPADVARASEAAARRETVVGPTTMPAGGVVPPPPAPAGQKYVTQANDSLIRIAKRHYGENNWREYKRIFEANKGVLTSESVVPVGKELIIPPLPTVRVAEAPAAGAPPLARSPAPTAAPAAPAPAPRRASEMTIEEIARHFAASPQSTPVPATQPAPAAAKRTHVVQPGDNLAKIARQYFNSNSKSAVERIFNANRDKLSSPDFLPVGRELTIPS